MRPDPSEYAPYYDRYIQLVDEPDIVPAIKEQLDTTFAWWATFPDSLGEVVHAPYTWTVRQVLLHLSDVERVFSYRILRFVRNDSTPIPGFEDTPYALHSQETTNPLSKVVEEFTYLRRSNWLMLSGFRDAHWSRHGEASGAQITVRALAYILVGHVRHHDAILRKRLATSL